jgi:hypothetical protein
MSDLLDVQPHVPVLVACSHAVTMVLLVRLLHDGLCAASGS